jgi:ABC-2 type transport system permease protein
MKKLFSKKLYLEALRQLRLPGIASFATVFLISLLFPLGYIINKHSYLDYQVVIDAGQLTPLLIVYMFGAPILLTVLLFYFMNKRNASDFYHSLPHSRISIFISFIAAILTVLYATIIVTAVSCGILFLFADVSFNAISIVYVIFTIMAGSTLVVGATAIGMCLTGTFISNLSVTVIALFLPRVLLVALTVITAEIVRIVPVIEMGVLGNVAYNIPSNIIMGAFVNNSFSFDRALTFIGGIIYTFVLAIVYIAIGCLLFNKRKSETAEKSSPSKLLQHAYRCLVTLPFTLIITGTMLMSSNPFGMFRDNTMEYITLFVICLLVYYLFEIITTRKFSNVIKATPVLLVLVGLNIIFALSVFVSKTVIYSYSPDAGEIKWVSMENLSDYYYYNYDATEIFTTNQYSSLMLEGLQIDDPAVIEIVAESLNQSIDKAKRLEKDKEYINMNTSTPYIIPFKLKSSGSFERNRILSLTTKQYNDLYKALKLNEKFIKVTTDLPDEKYITGKYVNFGDHSNIFIDGFGNSVEIIKDKDELYNIFKEEFKTLTVDEKFSIINSEYFTESGLEDSIKYYNTALVNLVFQGNVGADNFYVNCRINQLTPKSYEYVLNKVNKVAGDEAIQLLNSPIEAINEISFNIRSEYRMGIGDLNINGTIFKDESNNPLVYSKDEIQEIFSIILNASKRKLDITKPVCSFKYNSNFSGNQGGIIYISLTEEEFSRLNEMRYPRSF